MDYLSRQAARQRHEDEITKRRRKSEEEDRHLIENGRRERLGQPSLQEEANRRAVIERQNAARRSWAQQQQGQQPSQDQDDTRLQLQVRDAALQFMAHSDYYRSDRNFALLRDYIENHPELDATKEASFHTAYKALKSEMDRPSRTQEDTPEPQPVADAHAGEILCLDGVYRNEKELSMILEQDDKEYCRLLGLNRGARYRVVRSPLGFESIEDLNQ